MWPLGPGTPVIDHKGPRSSSGPGGVCVLGLATAHSSLVMSSAYFSREVWDRETFPIRPWRRQHDIADKTQALDSLIFSLCLSLLIHKMGRLRIRKLPQGEVVRSRVKNTEPSSL